MDKRGLIFIVWLCIALTPPLFIIADEGGITGSVVTGNATSSSFALTITISGPPTLNITKPLNKTYIARNDIRLNFTVSGQDNIVYNLDGNSNSSVSGNTTFNTNNGLHTLYLYANNSQGMTVKNVTFVVNETKIAIKYNNFKSNGSSSDLNESDFEDELQNFSSLTLEKSGHGKIIFNETVNLTDTDNSEIDLDGYVNISENHIEINSTNLRSLNKSATLTIYGLTSTNPRILVDGSVCPASQCTKLSYSSGTLVFNVTHFTSYSSEETPSAPGVSDNSGNTGSRGGGGGSSGGGVSIIQGGFKLSDEELSAKISQGEITTKSIVVTNNENRKIRITIEPSQKISDLISIKERAFDLNPRESRTVQIDFLARETTVPDLYIGKLVFKSENSEKEVLVVVEVASKGSLLDLKADILQNYKKVLPGDNIQAQITIFNLGNKKSDVSLDYSIKDSEGNEISSQHESVAVETQAQFVRSFDIPATAGYGKYFLYVKSVYGGKTASASAQFEVVGYKITNNEKLFIMIIIILVILVSTLVYYFTRQKRGYGKKQIRRINMEELLGR